MWSTQKSDYDFKDAVGVGSYGQVFEAIHLLNGKKVAIKQMELKFLERHNLLERVQSELENHARLEHENIVKFYTFFQDRTHIYLVMEFCHRPLIKKRQKLPLEEALIILRQLICGLEYLNEFNFIHRDLKPSNIMWGRQKKLKKNKGEKIIKEEEHEEEKEIVKILDLGLSCQLANTTEKKRTLCGTEGYLAPEIMSREGYDERVDVYSLGCVFFQILSGNSPKPPLVFSSDMNKEAQDLILQMTEKNPENRIPLTCILNHPLFYHHPLGNKKILGNGVPKWQPLKICMSPTTELVKSGSIVIYKDKTCAYFSDRDKTICRFFIDKITVEEPNKPIKIFKILDNDELTSNVKKKYSLMRRFLLRKQKLVIIQSADDESVNNINLEMTGIEPQFDFVINFISEEITCTYSTYQNLNQIILKTEDGHLQLDFESCCDHPSLSLKKIHHMLSPKCIQFFKITYRLITVAKKAYESSSGGIQKNNLTWPIYIKGIFPNTMATTISPIIEDGQIKTTPPPPPAIFIPSQTPNNAFLSQHTQQEQFSVNNPMFSPQLSQFLPYFMPQLYNPASLQAMAVLNNSLSQMQKQQQEHQQQQQNINHNSPWKIQSSRQPNFTGNASFSNETKECEEESMVMYHKKDPASSSSTKKYSKEKFIKMERGTIEKSRNSSEKKSMYNFETLSGGGSGGDNNKNSSNIHEFVFAWPSEEEVYSERIAKLYKMQGKEVSKTKLLSKFRAVKPHDVYLRVCSQFQVNPKFKYICRESVHDYYEKEIKKIYEKVNPEKLSKVLDKFQHIWGENIYKFYASICQKYGIRSMEKYTLKKLID